MKALVTRKRPDGRREKVLVEDWPDVKITSPTQILTRTRYSGVTNGTERNDLLGGNYAHPDEMLPAPWGYQNVGEVVEIGNDVKNVRIGDIVFSSCDHLEWALFDENFLYCKVPSGVDPKEAALFGMTSVAMRTCRHADIRMGERVLVIGAGIIGQVAAQIADAMGARVTIADINDERLALARSIGAAEQTVNLSESAWQDAIPQGAFQVVIDVAGVPEMETDLIRAASSRGRVMLIAGRRKVCYDFNTGQIHEITIMQNSHFDNSDLENLSRLVARGKVHIKPLLKDIVPVSQAKHIYDTLRDNPQKLLGTVFVW